MTRNVALKERGLRRLSVSLVRLPKRNYSSPNLAILGERTEADTDIELIEGDVDSILPPKRGRGRPETTGEFRKKQEREAKLRLLQQEQEERELLGMMEGSIDVPNPARIKAAQKWTDAEEKRIEYFQSASTEEAVSTVLSRMKGMYALADRFKGLNGIFQKQIKETTAIVIGAITVLHQRLAGTEVNDQLEISRDRFAG